MVFLPNLFQGGGEKDQGELVVIFHILSLSLLANLVQKECVFTFCKRLSLYLGKLRTFALFKLPMLLWGTV